MKKLPVLPKLRKLRSKNIENPEKSKTVKPLPRQKSESGVRVKIDEKTHWISADEQAPRQRLESLAADVKSEYTIRWHFVGLPMWPRAFRYAVLSSVADHSDRSVVEAKQGTLTEKCLLSALLHLVGTEQELRRVGAIREAVCEAAALCHPENVTEAVGKIRDAYTSAKGNCPSPAELARTIKNLIGASKVANNGDAERLARQFLATSPPKDAESDTTSIPCLAYHRDSWFEYDGGQWAELGDKELKARIVKSLQERGAGGVAIEDGLVRDVMVNLTGLCSAFPTRLQMPIWLAETGVPTTSPYTGCKNGRINVDRAMRTGKMPKLRPHSPRHFAKTTLGFNYDRSAKCPVWRKTLQEILPRVNDGDRRIEVFQEFAGWTLLPLGLHLESFLVVVGDGGNGKSTILDVLREMLGPENVSSVPIEQLGSEYRLYDVCGKLANIVNDMNHVDNFQEGVLKQLVSGEPIQVNRKYKSPVTMISTAKFIFATNQMPTVNDRSDAIYRRMICMPFMQKFDRNNRNTALKETLRRELPGIANWCLEGLMRLGKQKEFTRCSVCETALDEHRMASDPFLQFVDEMCEIKPKHSIEKQKLYSAYANWCKKNTRHPVNSATFYSRMKKVDGVCGYRPGKDGDRKHAYRGIELKG